MITNLTRATCLAGLVVILLGCPPAAEPPDAGGVSDAGPAGVDGGGSDAGTTDGGETGEEPVVCGRVLQRVTFEGVTGAGPEELGEGDSDENGISDRNEWGPLALTPLDTDADGVPDFEDGDDDADGLLDVHDAARLEPFEVADASSDDGPVVDAIAVVRDGGRASGVGRAEGMVEVEGRGLSCDALVLLKATDGTLNGVPSFGSSTTLRLYLPGGVTGELAVVVDGRVTPWVPFEAVPAGAPLLFDPESGWAPEGSRVVLRGEDLAQVTGVRFGEQVVPPAAVRADAVEVDVPAGAGDGTVQALAGEVAGNTLTLLPVHPVPAAVALPAGLPFGVTELEVIDGALEAGTPDATGALEVQVGRSSDVVAAVAPGDEGPTVLLAWVLPEDESVTLDAGSTAVALAAQLTQASGQVAPESWATLRARLAALAEVTALSSVLATALAADVGALEAPDETLARAALDAAVAAQAIVDAGLEDGSLLRADSVHLPDVTGPAAVAQIVPPTPQHDVGLEQIEGTGNVKVVNDTSVFLSAAISDNASKKLLARHVRDPFDPNMIDAQFGAIQLYRAKVVDLPGPGYRDSHVTILTPGVAPPRVEVEADRRAQFHLRFRVVLEQVFNPILGMVIGKGKKSFNRELAQLLIRHVPGAIGDSRGYFESGQVADALKVLVNAVLKDVDSVGPITRGVVVAAFKGTRGAVGLISKRLAAKMTPVLGQLEAFFDGVADAADVINVTKTIADLVTMPGRLEYDVIFGMGLVDLSPPSVKREHLARNIDLTGVNLHPVSGEEGLVVPLVDVRDKDPAGAGALTLDPTYASPDGLKLSFRLPEGFVSQAFGPVEVKVRKGSEEAVTPKDLEIELTFEATAIDPRSADPGAAVTITGRGFEQDRGMIRVEFREPNAQGVPRLVEVPGSAFTSLSETRIVFPAPQLDTSIRVWDVAVVQGPVGFPLRSRPLSFLAAENKLWGSWRLVSNFAACTPGTVGPASLHYFFDDGIFAADHGNDHGWATDAADGRRGQLMLGTWTLSGNTVTVTGCHNDWYTTERTYTFTWDPVAQTLAGSDTAGRFYCSYSYNPTQVCHFRACLTSDNWNDYGIPNTNLPELACPGQ